jgi:hypothetical protein
MPRTLKYKRYIAKKYGRARKGNLSLLGGVKTHDGQIGQLQAQEKEEEDIHKVRFLSKLWPRKNKK